MSIGSYKTHVDTKITIGHSLAEIMLFNVTGSSLKHIFVFYHCGFTKCSTHSLITLSIKLLNLSYN